MKMTINHPLWKTLLDVALRINKIITLIHIDFSKSPYAIRSPTCVTDDDAFFQQHDPGQSARTTMCKEVRSPHSLRGLRHAILASHGNRNGLRLGDPNSAHSHWEPLRSSVALHAFSRATKQRTIHSGHQSRHSRSSSRRSNAPLSTSLQMALSPARRS